VDLTSDNSTDIDTEVENSDSECTLDDRGQVLNFSINVNYKLTSIIII